MPRTSLTRFVQKFLSAKGTAPPVALLTDFGNHDHYAGVMKAVMMSVNPDVRVIDISHAVDPHNVRQAAYLLWASYNFFPNETVFVTVVDPGVGSERDILLCRIARRWFLFPDNGTADFVLMDQLPERVFKVRQKNSPYILGEVSKTFHGRDIFAPIAAYVSKGISPEELGEPCQSPKPEFSFCRRPDTKASVLYIDHFGNIVTDIMGGDRRPVSLSVGRRTIDRWIGTYAQAPAGMPCLVTGSSGLTEIVLNGGSAAAKLRADSGTTVRVVWK